MLISTAVISLIEAGLQLTPTLIDAWRTEVTLSKMTGDPTDEQKAALDAALEEANTALQNA